MSGDHSQGPGIPWGSARFTSQSNGNEVPGMLDSPRRTVEERSRSAQYCSTTKRLRVEKATKDKQFNVYRMLAELQNVAEGPRSP